jgi:hypothetical protein
MVAPLIDGLRRLRCIAVRDNPCTQPWTHARAQLLRTGERFRAPRDCLEVLDTPITDDDRLDVLRAIGARKVGHGVRSGEEWEGAKLGEGWGGVGGVRIGWAEWVGRVGG